MVNWQPSSNFELEDSFEEDLETSSSSDTTGSVYNRPRGFTQTTAARRPLTRPQILLPPDDVVSKYGKLKNPSTMARLSVKLAREAFFGKDVMMKSTVCGQRSHAGLPEAELYNLKLFLVQLFPFLNKAEFEDKWKECLVSIGQACKTMRSKLQY